MKRGHNLCNEISKYTEGQILFQLLVEEKAYNDSVLPQKTDLTISGNDSIETIKDKMKMFRKRERPS